MSLESWRQRFDGFTDQIRRDNSFMDTTELENRLAAKRAHVKRVLETIALRQEETEVKAAMIQRKTDQTKEAQIMETSFRSQQSELIAELQLLRNLLRRLELLHDKLRLFECSATDDVNIDPKPFTDKIYTYYGDYPTEKLEPTRYAQAAIERRCFSLLTSRPLCDQNFKPVVQGYVFDQLLQELKSDSSEDDSLIQSAESLRTEVELHDKLVANWDISRYNELLASVDKIALDQEKSEQDLENLNAHLYQLESELNKVSEFEQKALSDFAVRKQSLRTRQQALEAYSQQFYVLARQTLLAFELGSLQHAAASTEHREIEQESRHEQRQDELSFQLAIEEIQNELQKRNIVCTDQQVKLHTSQFCSPPIQRKCTRWGSKKWMSYCQNLAIPCLSFFNNFENQVLHKERLHRNWTQVAVLVATARAIEYPKVAQDQVDSSTPTAGNLVYSVVPLLPEILEFCGVLGQSAALTASVSTSTTIYVSTSPSASASTLRQLQPVEAIPVNGPSPVGQVPYPYSEAPFTPDWQETGIGRYMLSDLPSAVLNKSIFSTINTVTLECTALSEERERERAIRSSACATNRRAHYTNEVPRVLQLLSKENCLAPEYNTIRRYADDRLRDRLISPIPWDPLPSIRFHNIQEKLRADQVNITCLRREAATHRRAMEEESKNSHCALPNDFTIKTFLAVPTYFTRLVSRTHSQDLTGFDMMNPKSTSQELTSSPVLTTRNNQTKEAENPRYGWPIASRWASEMQDEEELGGQLSGLVEDVGTLTWSGSSGHFPKISFSVLYDPSLDDLEDICDEPISSTAAPMDAAQFKTDNPMDATQFKTDNPMDAAQIKTSEPMDATQIKTLLMKTARTSLVGYSNLHIFARRLRRP